MIVSTGLGQPPAIDVAVTRYCTLPEAEVLGLVSTWLMVFPFPALAPVTPPVTAPIVHTKVLGVVAVRLISGLVPLQVESAGAFVIIGVGNTVTVAMMLKGAPTQPLADVGVTIYSTVPEEAALGLVSTWLMTLPVPAEAPVIPPVIVPMVQVNVLGTLAVSGIFGLPPLQILVAGGVVICGLGFTNTVTV